MPGTVFRTCLSIMFFCSVTGTYKSKLLIKCKYGYIASNNNSIKEITINSGKV